MSSEQPSRLTPLQLACIGILLLSIGLASGYILGTQEYGNKNGCANSITYYDKTGKEVLWQDCTN